MTGLLTRVPLGDQDTEGIDGRCLSELCLCDVCVDQGVRLNIALAALVSSGVLIGYTGMSVSDEKTLTRSMLCCIVPCRPGNIRQKTWFCGTRVCPSRRVDQSLYPGSVARKLCVETAAGCN